MITLKNAHFRSSSFECPARFFSFYHLVHDVPRTSYRRPDAFASRNKVATDVMARLTKDDYCNTHGDVFVSVDKLDIAVACVVGAGFVLTIDRSDITGKPGDILVRRQVDASDGSHTHAHLCDVDAGVERRAQDGYIKWERLSGVLATRGFVFQQYVQSQGFARVSEHVQKPYVGGKVAPTWLHIDIAHDIAKTARAPSSTVQVLRHLRTEEAQRCATVAREQERAGTQEQVNASERDTGTQQNDVLTIHVSELKEGGVGLRAIFDALPDAAKRHKDYYNARTYVKSRLNGVEGAWDNVRSSIPIQHIDGLLKLLIKESSEMYGKVTAKVDPLHDEKRASTSAMALPQSSEPFQQVTYQHVMTSVRRVTEQEANDAGMPEAAGYGKVHDVIILCTGQNRDEARKTWSTLKKESEGKLLAFIFPGSNGHKTPIASLKTLLEIVMIAPGKIAKTFRTHCAETLCRVFAGDPNLKPELDANLLAMSPTERRDMLRDVPGAASVCDDDTTNITHFTTRVCTVPPVENLVTENGAVLRVRRRANAADGVLGPVPDLESIVIPAVLAGRPGCYVGVKGHIVTEDGRKFWHIKVGLDNDDVEKRPAEHASLYPHYRDLWAGAITSIACMPHTLEDKLKAAFRNRPCVLVLEGHKREEFLIPEEYARKTIDSVTNDLERALSTRVHGTHAFEHALTDGSELDLVVPLEVKHAFDKATSGCTPHTNSHLPSSDTNVALSREVTRRAEIEAQHKRLEVREQTKRDMITRGYTVDDIERVMNL